MHGILRAAAIVGVLAGVTLLGACGSDPKPETNVIVVPQNQPTPSSTTVVPQGTTVVPPGTRVICSDGRSPPC